MVNPFSSHLSPLRPSVDSRKLFSVIENSSFVMHIDAEKDNDSALPSPVSPSTSESDLFPTPVTSEFSIDDVAEYDDDDHENHINFNATSLLSSNVSHHRIEPKAVFSTPADFILSDDASECDFPFVYHAVQQERGLSGSLETPATPNSRISEWSETSESECTNSVAGHSEAESVPAFPQCPKSPRRLPGAWPEDEDDEEEMGDAEVRVLSLNTNFELPGAYPLDEEEVVTPVAPSTSSVAEIETEALLDEPTSFILPDLVSHCHFPLTYHPDGDEVAAQSDRWLDLGCPELSPKKRKALYGLKAGELTAYCYPTCDKEHLRVVSDFMNYLFHLDNISDGMMKSDTDVLADVVMNALWYPENYRPANAPGKEQPEEEISAGKLARDYWRRCIKDAGPGVQARFKESLGLFFEAVNVQAADRDSNIIPDIESYISVRRDTSGCKPVFDLIEYALRIDLPDDVVNHPIIKALNQGTNDLVTWSNDIFSYNVEQSRGDTHNMIVILMTYHGMNLQEAVDYVGELCRQTIDAFCENMKRVPSFGSDQLDKDVAGYIQGLQDWIVGSLHWSFMTERYFGLQGAEVKKHRVVTLLPKRV